MLHYVTIFEGIGSLPKRQFPVALPFNPSGFHCGDVMEDINDGFIYRLCDIYKDLRLEILGTPCEIVEKVQKGQFLQCRILQNQIVTNIKSSNLWFFDSLCRTHKFRIDGSYRNRYHNRGLWIKGLRRKKS